MIGYYVHHQGSGHRHRALSIARRIGDDVTLLGSLGPARSIAARYIELPRDDVPDPDRGIDLTAGGSLHWAPLHHPGHRDRHLALARWIAESSPRLLVSDVSVEVLLLARLLSVPPVAVALRGLRLDRAHAAGYDAAIGILAPWSRQTQHEWPARWLAKTTWTGMISRFDGRPRQRQDCDHPGLCVVIMLGRGGHGLRAQDLVEAAAVGGVHWHLLGGPLPATDGSVSILAYGDVGDPWPMLCSADVVVAAAGNNAIADVAAARAPLVAVAQPRPFDEQVEHAAILAGRGLCVSARPWPGRREWPDLLARAQRIGGGRWAEHSDGEGARRAADALESLAAQPAPVADRALLV